MPTPTTIPVGDQEFQQMMQIDTSIRHWSMEHMQLTLRLQELESTVRSLYVGRKQLLDRICSAAGVDPTHVIQAELMSTKEGAKFNLVLQDSETPPGKEQGGNSTGS